MSEIGFDLKQTEAKVMDGLKDFQRATVNRIDDLFRSGQNRVLISDEVGLGKTLIARGTIAKTAVMRHELKDPLFKVVYICSNLNIANQNLSKLQINDNKDEKTKVNAGSSRLSMQHLNIFKQMYNEDILRDYIQLIPLTPDTSFRMTKGNGSVIERALMFAILRRIPSLFGYEQELEIIMKDTAYSAWGGWACAGQEDCVLECDGASKGKYLEYMLDKVSSALSKDNVFENLIGLCKKVKANQKMRVAGTNVIGRLRMMFAQISVDLLNPDLVIMDEFQRFKYLIDAEAETETGLLAHRFFTNNDVKILLLSATPYKLYSTLEEIDENQTDEHYAEFFNVMGFLFQNKEKNNSFKEIWSNYSVKLREMSLEDITVVEVKKSAEDAMYGGVCRTERISAIKSGDFIDDSSIKTPLRVSERDITSYIQAQQLLDEMGANSSLPIDYIKSSPYLLSFMRNYQLKKNVEKYFEARPNEIKKANKPCLWIERSKVDGYKEIESSNARLDLLKQYAFQDKSELLLWVPPSKPYYEPQGVFKGTTKFSKILVFSAWEMVPRMIAALISYEAERRTVGKLSQRAKKEELKNAHYFAPNSKRYPVARLRFSVSDGEPKVMSLFCLLYPSEFLAHCFNPIETLNENLSLIDLEQKIKQRISDQIDLLNIPMDHIGRPDERWYYLAPLLLDSEKYVLNWLESGSELVSEQIADEEEEIGQTGFVQHLEKLRELRFERNLILGKKPDNLLQVLTDMAIASPAICAFRSNGHHAVWASQLAKVFINRLNTPESTAVISLCYGKARDDGAHWEHVLRYCKAGNLQAVFDEYAHILMESNGLTCSKHKYESLHTLMLDAMTVHSASYSVDTYRNFKGRVEGYKTWPVSLRSHFAVGFYKGEGDNEKSANRKESIRNSFNSPFRPFVLATTSIGQEGLDFHYYCRKIMHWNLPSNPIDLEQREGRINRFKCLAIRQNIALRYSDITFEEDIWNEMFATALKNEKDEHTSELVPFWCLANDQDIKIERIVPLYPLSRDVSTYERLIKILSLYRLTLGQARQEELLEHILKKRGENEGLKNLFIDLSPFSRERAVVKKLV